MLTSAHWVDTVVDEQYQGPGYMYMQQKLCKKTKILHHHDSRHQGLGTQQVSMYRYHITMYHHVHGIGVMSALEVYSITLAHHCMTITSPRAYRLLKEKRAYN